MNEFEQEMYAACKAGDADKVNEIIASAPHIDLNEHNVMHVSLSSAMHSVLNTSHPTLTQVQILVAQPIVVCILVLVFVCC